MAHLGKCYTDSDWRPVLKAIMDAEGDTEIALNAVDSLAKAASCWTGLKIRIPARPRPLQLTSVETELMQSVNNLKARNRIFGELQTIDKILDPAEERDMGEFLEFEGGDKAIADEVRREIAIANGEVINVDLDDEDYDGDDEMHISVTRKDVLDLCQRLEGACMQFGNPQTSLDLSAQLRIFRAELRREELMTATQTSLDQFFSM